MRFGYARVRAHGEAVEALVGLGHLLRVEGDVEGFERVQVHGGELGGDAGGEHFLADFGGQVGEGWGGVDYFAGAGVEG